VLPVQWDILDIKVLLGRLDLVVRAVHQDGQEEEVHEEDLDLLASWVCTVRC